MANFAGYLQDKDGNKLYADMKPINWTNGTEVKTNESIDGKPIYKKYVDTSFTTVNNNTTLATGVDKMIGYELMVERDANGQWHPVNAYLINPGENMAHLCPIFYNTANHSILTYITNTVFANKPIYGFIYYTKLSD